MASAPRPASRPHQTWRERSRSSESTVEGRRVKRWLSSILLLLLVGTLAWLVWQFYLKQRIHFANLSVTQYSRNYSDAIPPAPYFENDAEFLDQSIDCDNLDDYTTFASMAELTGRLNEIVSRPDRDLLVLYVSAHGISLDGGGKPEAYLLCSDFTVAKGIAAGGLSVSKFLKQVSDCQAGVKIIILDAGHLSTEPRLGVIVNEFPYLLEKAVKDTKDENLWVLSANSMHESSHVAHGRRQSIFNYFVVRGLTGDADGDENGKVDLVELTSFVGGNVRTWMESQYGGLETQTPQILWGGGDIDRTVIDTKMRTVVLPIQMKPTVAGEDAQKTEPSTPKASDPGKPKTESAVDAMPRDRGGLLGRLTRPSGISLLSLAGAAAPEQPAAGPASPTKASGDAPAAASGSSVETAKPGPESKKADAGKAEPESKKAVPAADPKASPAAPDTANKKDPADQAPAASGATPPKGAVKREKEDDKAARTKNDKWSSVRSRWDQRDRLMQPGKGHDWTPIDYAPLRWRRFESEILDSEARVRDRPASFDDRRTDLTTFDQELKDFIATSMNREAKGPVHDALKTRNHAIYRAIDLVAWHARASWAKQEPLGEYPDIVKLLSEMGQLERSLAAAVKEPDDDEGTDSEDLATLESHRKAVEIGLEKIEKRLNQEASQAVQLVARAANAHGVARIIEDLLSIPLEDTDLRIKLLEALELTGTVPKESTTEKRVTVAQVADEVRMLQGNAERQAKLPSSWTRAIEQANLETMLAGLADSEAVKELKKVIRSTNEGRDGERRQIRTLSPKLADYYRDLWFRIDNSRESERELRLFPLAAESKRTKNPILERRWLAPPKRGFEFEFEIADQIELDPSSAGTEIKGTLAAKGGFTGKVKLTLAFDSSKLKIDDMSASASRPVEPDVPREISFDGDHPSAALRYRISRDDLLPRATTPLTFSAVAQSNPDQRESVPFNVQAPAPDSIELVVSPAASGDYLASEADLEGNGPLILGSITGATQSTRDAASLSTFPGHVTSFLFKLKHDSGRKRTVSVDLLGVSVTNEEQIEKLRRLAKEKPNDLLKPQTGVEKLRSVPKMELSEVETVGAPIPFPPPPAPPADGKGANAATDASKPPPPSIVGGLVVIVRDLAKPELGPWVNWIDVAPWAPWHYVDPTVKYDGQRQLTVKLRLVDRARPLDGHPITVAWEESNEVRQADIVVRGAELNEKENRYRSQLEARVHRDRTKQAEVRLTVDGYPRGFVFKVPLDGPQEKKLDDRQSNLENIKIVQPMEGDFFKAPDAKMDVKVQVAAPEINFRSFHQGQRDRVELGIDKTGDGTIEPLDTRYTDREQDISIKEIGSDGRVSINTEVKDLEFNLQSPQLNKRAKLVAQLILDGRDADKDSVEVRFDQTLPNLEVLGAHERMVHQGEKILLEIAADDNDSSGVELSGVKSVKFVIGRLDAKSRETAENVETRNPRTGNYELNFEPPDKLALGFHNLHFWATDNVGLESQPHIVTLEVRPPVASPGKTPGPATKGRIEGQVVSGNDPVPRATVQMVEGTGTAATVKPVATSDEKGNFVIKDVKPGTYQLQAEGNFKNRRRKAPPISVTVPEPAKTVKAQPLQMQ